MVEPNRFVHTIVLILSFPAELVSDILTFLNVVNNFKFVVIMIWMIYIVHIINN